MKAVLFHEHGGPEKLLYEEIPLPKISSDEVLIHVKAASLNHLDIWVRQGSPAYKVSLPHISGCDASGVVAETGRSVKNLKIGDRVFVSPSLPCFDCPECKGGRDNLCRNISVFGARENGGYAEYAKVKAVHALKLPKSVSFEEGAAFPLVTMTAWHMLVTRANIQKGQSALVIAAGSGVGSMAVQIAKLKGAKVIATASGAEKLQKAKALGADFTIDHSLGDFSHAVRKFTQGRGVDIVFEHVGPETWESSLKSLAKGGTLVTCGATSGAQAQFDLRYLFSRELNVLGSYTGTRKDLIQVARLVGQKKLKPVIDRILPLAQARSAQERMLSRNFFGKIVLSI